MCEILFVAQGDHGIHASGTARRDVARKKRDASQDHNDGDEGDRIRRTNAVVAIGESRVEPVADAFLAKLFLDLFDAAQFHVRGALRFVRGHAGTNVFVDQH